MSWDVALAGGVALLIGLLIIGVPIFVSFLILNITGVLVLFGDAGFGLLANSIYSSATYGALTAVPLFIVMGELLFRSGAMEVLFDSLDRLVGRVRGRQFVLCILLSAILGALSGAAMAVAGLLGRSLYPTMLQRGYDPKLSAGTILAGASLDPIIPPSVLAILIATIAQISTGKLLIAGIVPGIFLTVMFLGYVFIRLKFNPKLSPDIDAEVLAQHKGGAIVAVLRMIPSLFIFFLVMGLVMFGIATPTEAAATGVLGSVILAASYRKLSLDMIKEALTAGVRVSSLLLIIMCSAVMFSQLLTFTGAPQALGELVAHLQLSSWLMLTCMIALPFVLFMFLDQVAIMLVLIPIYKPILLLYKFDEIWFYTLFLIVATVGGISPPFGYTLFAFKSAAPQATMAEIFSAAWPFVWLIMLGLVLMVLFPPIITALPALLDGR